MEVKKVWDTARHENFVVTVAIPATLLHGESEVRLFVFIVVFLNGNSSLIHEYNGNGLVALTHLLCLRSAHSQLLALKLVRCGRARNY